MIKRTLYFGNPAFLSLKLKQLVVSFPEVKASDGNIQKKEPITLPIEDLGIIVLDCKQLTITSALISGLLDNNCAIVTCNEKHMPDGLLLPLSGHTIQSERFREQIEASVPLRKQLWQQTIEKKIVNQEAVLRHTTGNTHPNMSIWATKVRSGDVENMEGRAAAYYWKNLFPHNPAFVRDRDAEDINMLLNYGYAILRAIVARALVASGLLPTLGIHHHNRYNAYCLADDIMEPYRPYVDKIVYDLVASNSWKAQLTKESKSALLGISTEDVIIDGTRHPLSVAVGLTASSLRKCFSGESRKISYPTLE